MPLFVYVFTSATIVGLIVVVVLMLHRIKAETDQLYKITYSVILIVMVVCIATLVLFWVSGSASAAENSADPAKRYYYFDSWSNQQPKYIEGTRRPITEDFMPPTSAGNALTVKGYTSCPTEFNPDDLGWAMHEEKRADTKIDKHLVIKEHKRVFSYFPDPEQRIFVGMRKWRNPDCVAELFSYGSANGVDQKRVLAVIRSVGKTIIFLLTENGWEAGDDWETFFDNSAGQYNLVFALFRNKVQVASRALPVEPAQRFFHFQFNEEPVE